MTALCLQAWQYQHLRAYAAKSKGTAAAAPATASSKAPKPVDPYAPPDFRLKRVPNAVKGNVIDKLTAGQVGDPCSGLMWPRDCSASILQQIGSYSTGVRLAADFSRINAILWCCTDSCRCCAGPPPPHMFLTCIVVLHCHDFMSCRQRCCSS